MALLGRNTAGGTAVAALLFGALLTGTSNRNINLSIDPTLVQYLTFMIEGLIVLLVSTDVITLRLLKGGRRLGVAFRRRPAAKRRRRRGRRSMSVRATAALPLRAVSPSRSGSPASSSPRSPG